MQQMLDGTLPGASPVPSIKEMRVRYGASFSTIAQALQSLVADGRLTPHGRGFRVSELPAPAGRARLVLIAHSEAAGDLGTVVPRNPEFLRQLERECLRLRLALDVRDEQNATAASHEAPVVGYIVWIRGIFFERLCELLRQLGRTQLPVAVMDEDGTTPLRPYIARNPRIRHFLVAASSSAGQAVGELLLRLGHRRVAYLTPVGASSYCRKRYEGIARVFAQAGMADGLLRMAPGNAESFEHIVAHHQAMPGFARIGAELERFSQTITPSAQACADTFDTFYRDTMLLRRAIQRELFPVLDRAILDRSISALVGVNDWTALIAMVHARERGVRVPEELALLGFDDTFEAFAHGLSSYDYNMPALVQAMLEHILSTPQRRLEALPPLEVPGVLRLRRSTGHSVQARPPH